MDLAVGFAGLAVERDDVVAALSAAGVATRPFFHPLSSLPAYSGAEDAERAHSSNVVSRRLGARGFNLPSALRLTEDDVDYVCETLVGILAT